MIRSATSILAKRWSKSVSLILLLVYLTAGLYPFQWQWPTFEANNSVVRTSGHMLRFPAPGIAFTSEVPEWLPQAIRSGSMEVTLEVHPIGEPPVKTTRIFTISDAPNARNLTIDQQYDDLIIRTVTTPRGTNIPNAYRVENIFSTPGWHHIVLKITASQLLVDVDAQRMLTVTLTKNLFQWWSRNCRLALGNEFIYNRSWLGEIRQARVTVAGTSIDYLAPGMLITPSHYSVRRHDSKIFLPFTSNKPVTEGSVLDWIINFLGFIPLGAWIVLLRRPRPSLLVATATCAGLSLCIETLQIFLAGRSSSLGDLLLNTLSGAIGAWIGQALVSPRASQN
jgi:hypothetical protein